MADNSPFWVVWNPAKGPPAYRHPTKESAEAEAHRIAKAQPGEEVFVLQSISGFKTHDPVEKRVFDDLPF